MNWDELNKVTLESTARGLKDYFDVYLPVRAGLCCVKCKSQFVWVHGWGPACACPPPPIREPFIYAKQETD